MQLHDNGYRAGKWIALGQSAVEIVRYARAEDKCSHVYSGKGMDADPYVTHSFTLSGKITNHNSPEYYAEFTLTYGEFSPPRCPDDYNYTGPDDEAPWDDAIAEVRKWHWRAKAADR